MKKTLIFSFVTLLIASFHHVSAQEIKQRLILIGDAGEMNVGQMESIKSAAQHVLRGRTTTVFLGDNIYPTGMALPGNASYTATSNILTSQFQPMRQAGASVYFIPGNHDWDKSGPNGLAKIQAQGQFLAGIGDPQVKMIPNDGCPEPVAIELGDKLVMIAYDSEWWLFPFNKTNPDCECANKNDVIFKLRELRDKYADRMMIIASHHPFQSYGAHGGYFTFKNHLFPLTALHQNLYIPLPVIGSLYPFLRNTFLNPEDLKHPLYKEMATKITGVFEGMPNVVYAAGHEHGLQLIKSKQLQIVSGAGAKHSPNKQGKNSLFHSYLNGFVTADQLADNSMRYEVYTFTETGVQKVFSYQQPFSADLKNVRKVSPIKADSIAVRIKPVFDSVSKVHRYFFGDNYRKDYAMPTKLPVIRISKIKGGLKPVQLGGGNQSRSLRLKDNKGKEYVLRSVEKYPEVLLPEALRTTFAKSILEDNMASQHPFTSLVVPVLAQAAGVPHSNPIIGMVSPDENFGDYGPIFENTVCLLEERHPIGDSDNTFKLFKKLDKDNDNSVDAKTYLRAKALDVLMGDWDRHEDQWRWKADTTTKGLRYKVVPRDRDQVFFLTDGKIQRFAQRSDLLPMMQGFERDLKDINWFLWEGREMNSRILSQYTEAEWDKEIIEFCALFTDEVFEQALQRLPKETYDLRAPQFLAQLKQRRASLPREMNKFYHFFNRIVDINGTDKNEKAMISDAGDGKLKIELFKLNKSGQQKDLLFSNTFDPKITKWINIYLRDGNDSININKTNSPIHLRIITAKGKKHYQVAALDQPIRVFGLPKGITTEGKDAGKLHMKLSKDTLNTRFVSKDMYPRTTLLPNIGFNLDDGISLGAIVKRTNPGFRKQPYGNSQSLSFLYSFATSAFRFKYSGDWLNALGKADILLQASVQAPDNTRNFFGVGNNSVNENEIRFYRIRYNLVQVDPMLRWRRPKSTFQVGPSFQYYGFDPSDNQNKLVNNVALIGSPDSLTIDQNKFFAGATVEFTNDTRDRQLLPTLGSHIQFKLQGYKGLSKTANSFGQFIGSIALYKNIDGRANVVLANRFGGTITVGKPTFYQHAHLGGEGSLLGYRQFRFAGRHSFYNNLETRVKFGDFVSYILPGEVGMLGLYDVGRVWAANEQSNTWHQGVGGGLYFAPASLAVVRALAVYSKEGWYPYFSMNLRF